VTPATDRLLRSLRRIRSVAAGDHSTFVREILALVREEAACSRLTLRRAREEDVVVRGASPSPDGAGVELRVTVGPTEGLFLFEGGHPLDESARGLLEILGGEVLLRIEQDRAQRESGGSARQLALLARVSLAGAGTGEPATVMELADRAARELGAAFSTLSITVHVVVDDRLELVARRADDGAAHIDDAPAWLRSISLDSGLLQALAAAQKKVVAKAVSDISAPARALLEPLGIGHVIAAPLLVGETLIGTMTLALPSAGPSAVENGDLIAGVAARLAAGLEQARRLEEEQQRSRDLELIKEIGRLVAEQRELPAVLSTVVNELARVADVPRVSLFLVDAERKFLTIVACNQALHDTLTIPVDSRATASHAFRTRQPVVIENTVDDPRTSMEIAGLVRVRSTLAVPLITNRVTIGVIAVGEQRRQRKFSSREVARLTAIANVVSPVIANAKMLDDLRRSYEALSRAQADLVTHERLAALGELSAVIAHEVRNPLAVIYTSLGSLRRIPPVHEEAALLLNIVQEEAARLNRIVADLLDFVRPYSSHPRPVQVEALVHRAIDGARRPDSGPRVSIEAKVELGPEPLVLDGTMLEQALKNLVVNALHATPPGGSVRVCARREREPSGPVERLCFDVIDEGPGIDDADTRRIFQPFYTTKAAGTGLGLAVVRRIADALGGTVEVSQGVERGAIFRLTVPLVSGSEGEPSRAQ
jgi:signal transduction histidine kinase